MLQLTSLRKAPAFARGLVRDLRVRWAMEELGLAYQTRLIAHDDPDFNQHFSRQPFGQVPVLEDNGLVLFESGAIVWHLAEYGEPLLSQDPGQRARAKTWLFAALNTIEPAIAPLAEIDLMQADQSWAQARRPAVEARVCRRLDQLSAWLDGRDYLESSFSVGDLMMVSVLLILRHTDLVERDPRLCAYRDRCLDRPAYQRALRDHLADCGAM